MPNAVLTSCAQVATPQGPFNMAADLQSCDWSEMKFDVIPTVMAEFGAFKQEFTSVQQGSARRKRVSLMLCSCRSHEAATNRQLLFLILWMAVLDFGHVGATSTLESF